MFTIIVRIIEWCCSVVWEVVRFVVEGIITVICSVAEAAIDVARSVTPASVDGGVRAVGNGNAFFTEGATKMLDSGLPILIVDCLPRRGESFVGNEDQWIREAEAIRNGIPPKADVVHVSKENLDEVVDKLKELEALSPEVLIVQLAHAAPDGTIHLPNKRLLAAAAWQRNEFRNHRFLGLSCYSEQHIANFRGGLGSYGPVRTTQIEDVLTGNSIKRLVSNTIDQIGSGQAIGGIVVAAGAVSLEEIQRGQQMRRPAFAWWGLGVPCAWYVFTGARRHTRPRRNRWVPIVAIVSGMMCLLTLSFVSIVCATLAMEWIAYSAVVAVVSGAVPLAAIIGVSHLITERAGDGHAFPSS